MTQITMVTTSNMDYDQRLNKVLNSMHHLPLSVCVIDRGRPSSLKPWFSKGVLFYIEWNVRVAWRLWRSRPDGVYVADIDSVLSVILLKYLGYKMTLVLDLHELYTDTPELLHAPTKRRIWSMVEKLAFKCSEALITVNGSLQRIFNERYSRSPLVVSNFPLLKEVKEVDDCKKHKYSVLYYQGALNAGRGLECAIDSMQLLEGWELWLVGSGDLDTELKTRVKEYGLEKKVKFFGKRLPEDLPGLACQATIGLNLLEAESANYYYSLANKFFDYMQVGLPSINMDFPEYNHVLKKHPTGEVIAELLPKILVDAVHKITSDKVVYNRYVENSLQAAEIYVWEGEEQKLLPLLKSYFNVQNAV